MNKNIIIVGLVALILGTGIGYMINSVKHGSHDKSSYHDTKAPTTMEHTMSGMTGSLNGKTGEALEIAFLEGMITHHEGAVAMAKELKAPQSLGDTDQSTQNGTTQGKININEVCEGALIRMTFPDGAAADAFVKDCKEGKYPEVIEEYKASLNLGAGVEI